MTTPLTTRPAARATPATQERVHILHITDASSSGVLAAVTTLARAQSALPGTRVSFAYVPRADTPPHATIQELTGPAVHLQRWAERPGTALPALGARTLATLLGRDRPGIVHLHSSRTGMLGRAAALLSGQRRRVVYSPHCFAFDRSDAHALQREIFRSLERFGTVLAPRLVLVSDTEAQLARATLPGCRTAVLANRVDAAALTAVSAEAREGGLRVVHVGRIAPQKRPGEFAQIARHWLRDERRGNTQAPPSAPTPATTFRWLGDGDRSLLGPAGADGDVEISGWLDRAQLHAELAAADLLLFTSAGEGMPIAVLEAQAMGIPVLAHDVTGLSDIVDHDVTGLLGADTAALFRGLGELAVDAPRRHAMGRAARARIRERFDLADLAADSFAAYRQLGLLPAGAEVIA